jgi:hypothetical protein
MDEWSSEKERRKRNKTKRDGDGVRRWGSGGIEPVGAARVV